MNEYMRTKVAEMSNWELEELLELVKDKLGINDIDDSKSASRADKLRELSKLTRVFNPEKIVVEDNRGKIVIGKNYQSSFLSLDLIDDFEEVYEIMHLKAYIPGGGRSLLNEFVKEDKCIVLKAEPLFDTEEEYLACTDLEERIAKLSRFYESAGFIDINSFVGYENAVAFMYKNECTMRWLEKNVIGAFEASSFVIRLHAKGDIELGNVVNNIFKEREV
jgi:hypothetical protein